MNGVVIAETMRRCMTVALGGFLALLVIVALSSSAFDRPAAAWPTLVTLLAFILGSIPIGPEFSAGTLQLILTKPVNRSVYLVSRVAGVVAVVWGAAVLAFCVELIGRAIWNDVLRFDLVFAGLVNSFAKTTLICCLLVFFGSFTRAYFNVAIYFVLMIGLSVSEAGVALTRGSRGRIGAWLRQNDSIDRAINAVQANLFPDAPPFFDRSWLLVVLSNAAIAIVLACFIFRRREVPYGAD